MEIILAVYLVGVAVSWVAVGALGDEDDVPVLMFFGVVWVLIAPMAALFMTGVGFRKLALWGWRKWR